MGASAGKRVHSMLFLPCSPPRRNPRMMTRSPRLEIG